MAQRDDGTIIDPFGGRSDLEQRLLRHVSPAFAEDPVRILRVARFSARIDPLGFRIAPDTLDLMRQMVQAGETAALVPERVWRELERALGEPQPEAFFETLAACGALDTVLPELGPLWIAAAEAKAGHCVGLPALRQAAKAGCSNPVRMAAFMASLPAEQIETFCERLRVPNEYRELALLSARLGTQLPDGEMPQPALVHDPAWLLGLLEGADAFRRPGRFAEWLEVLGARASARGGSSAAIGASIATLKDAAARATAVRLDPDAIRGLPGPEIAQQLRRLRLAALGAPQDD
jgi:tRNA nucleotidyltransferase (CCA-adding enzyme)